MLIPLTYKVTFLFERKKGHHINYKNLLPPAISNKFKLVRVASHTHWPEKKDMTAFEALLEPVEVLELMKMAEVTIDPKEREFGDLPRQAARYSPYLYGGHFKYFLQSMEAHTLQVQALMDTDTIRAAAELNYDLVGFEDAMVWGATYVPKAVQWVEAVMRTLTLPSGATLCYRDYDGITDCVNTDNPENFQFPTHVPLEGVGQKFLFPLEEECKEAGSLIEVTDHLTTYLPMFDVNGVEIKEGMTVRTQQPSGGILPPAPPRTGIVEAAVDAFGRPTLQITYEYTGSGRGFGGEVYLHGQINEVLLVCYKTDKPCPHNCEGLCKESC